MSRPISITPPGSAVGPSFDEPFEMLQACHERLGRMLALLQKLRSQMRSRGADDQVRQAARDVMRYFDVAAPQHHRDEELHVFPSLLGLPDPTLAELVGRLQQDHLLMDSRWVAARSLLEEVAEGQRSSFNEADDAVLDAFAQVYQGHIEAEESIAFPRAMGAMDADRMSAMSSDMKSRRGVK
jgi:hemerythrin-like domain-containing protein